MYFNSFKTTVAFVVMKITDVASSLDGIGVNYLFAHFPSCKKSGIPNGVCPPAFQMHECCLDLLTNKRRQEEWAYMWIKEREGRMSTLEAITERSPDAEPALVFHMSNWRPSLEVVAKPSTCTKHDASAASFIW